MSSPGWDQRHTCLPRFLGRTRSRVETHHTWKAQSLPSCSYHVHSLLAESGSIHFPLSLSWGVCGCTGVHIQYYTSLYLLLYHTGRFGKEEDLPHTLVYIQLQKSIHCQPCIPDTLLLPLPLSPPSVSLPYRRVAKGGLFPKNTKIVGYARSDLTIEKLKEKCAPFLKVHRTI